MTIAALCLARLGVSLPRAPRPGRSHTPLSLKGEPVFRVPVTDTCWLFVAAGHLLPRKRTCARRPLNRTELAALWPATFGRIKAQFVDVNPIHPSSRR